MIPLNELPADVVELIAKYYKASRRADDERQASAVLQARLRRHLTQRDGFIHSSNKFLPPFCFKPHVYSQPFCYALSLRSGRMLIGCLVPP